MQIQRSLPLRCEGEFLERRGHSFLRWGENVDPFCRGNAISNAFSFAAVSLKRCILAKMRTFGGVVEKIGFARCGLVKLRFRLR